MKRLFRAGAVLAVFLGFFSTAQAEQISRFSAVIRINPDGSLSVTEEIVYDFDDLERHGIFRIIPYRYRDSFGNYTALISDIAVADETGLALPFTTSRSGGNLEIKIGDPDTLITGAHTYALTYSIQRAILFEKTYDELYWNVTGNGWPVSLAAITADVLLPEGAPAESVGAFCYEGEYGSEGPCPSIGVVADADETVTLISFGTYALSAGEGLTIKVQMPKGFITEPSPLQNALWFIKDNWHFSIPVAVFSVMFYLWWTRGRDPRGRGTIIQEYEPPKGLSPGEVGTLYDEQAHMKDISAEIIQLAIQGYLKIRQDSEKKLIGTKEEYALVQLREPDDALNPAQKKLVSRLFGEHAQNSIEPGALREVDLSDLKYKFGKDSEEVKADLYQAAVDKGFFTARPQSVRSAYIAAGAFVGFLAFIIGNVFGAGPAISAGLSGTVITVIGWFMPKRTYQGVLAKEHIEGFKRYLEVVEKDRFTFHNAPEKRPEQFMQWLPFAMALGVEKQWAEQFKDLAVPEPDWYRGSPGTAFNSIMFANSIGHLNSSVQQSVATKPSSGGAGGGGGFSGGGFGGGGGGSW